MIALLLSSWSSRLSAQGGTYCGQSYDFAVNNQSASSIFPGGGAWTSGSRIYVSGTFTVDQDLTCNALFFIMDPGAKINVTGTGTVFSTLSNTTFRGCSEEEMWYGIVVTNGGAISLKQTTVLEDAWIAITFTNTASVSTSELENSTLRDNMIGIAMTGPGTFTLAKFSGNTITRHTGDILPPPPGFSYSGSKLNRGIVLVQATADFASNAAQRNRIEGYRYGIYAGASNLTFANMTFHSSTDDFTAQDPLDGTDIFGLKSLINIGGSGANNCQFFYAPNSSILSRQTVGLSVNRASFQSPHQHGIQCVTPNAMKSPISITGNTFVLNGSKTVSGVFVERSPSSLPSAIGTSILGNTFSVTTSGHQKTPIVMIDVVGKVDALDAVEIQTNVLTNTSTWSRLSGIRVTGKGDNFRIMNENDLSWTAASNPGSIPQSLGIIAANLTGNNHLISDNDILSKLNGANSFLKAGISLENNPLTVLVCDNRPDKNHQNIFCAGIMGNTALKTNLIGDAAYGLFCKAGTDMPDQDRFENRWTGTTYVTRGAEYEGGAPLFPIFFDPSSTIPDDMPATVLPSTGWFFESTGSNSDCGLLLALTEQQQDIVDGNILPDTTAANWDARRTLLYHLMRYPDLATAEKDVEEYLEDEEIAETSPWLFAQAEWLFDQAVKLPSTSTLLEAFENMLEEYHYLSDSLVVLDEAQAQDTIFDTGIAQDRADVFLQLAAVSDSLEQLRAEAAEDVEYALDSTLDFIDGLPDTTDFEANLKSILDIAVRAARGDSLVEDDYTLLHAIAQQCPATGGISVQIAPLWLTHEEGIEYADKEWDENCSEARPTRIITPKQDIALRIQPNPARDQAKIIFPDHAISGIWQISDLTGRPVSGGKIKNIFEVVNTAEIPTGFYLLSCHLPTGQVSTTKLSICH